MSASNTVLGVSVGASTIHVARPVATNGSGGARTGSQTFDLQSVEVAQLPTERLTAEVIGVALAAGENIGATAVACRAESQAEALHTAMAHEKLDNYELVPELFAALEWLDKTGEIDGYRTIAVFDLGSAGLTLSVLDVESRAVLGTRRLDEISGSHFDSLIAQQQIDAGRVAMPADAAGFAELDALCRDAKEQLSTSTAVALPAPEGLVLLSRENFESLITVPLKDSARELRDVLASVEKRVDAVVVIGGGARIPLVAAALESSISLPVVVPDEPEAVAARGAALLARPVPASRRAANPGAARRTAPLAGSTGRRQRRRRELSGAGLAVGALVVIAAIGLGLGFGPKLVGDDSGGGGSATTVPAAPTTDSVAPIASSAPEPAPLPPAPAPAPVPAPVEAPAPVVREAPPPRTQDAPVEQVAPAPAPAPVPGPNTIVVPGLPPIVIPTIPPELIPQLPRLPGQ